MDTLVPILFVVLSVGVLVLGVWLTGRHHRKTWGNGRHGQEPRERYAPKIWFGQGQG